MQDTDYEWFLENYEKLFQKHGNCFVVIKNKQVIGVYKDYSEGVINTLKSEELGSFIVQKCHSNKAISTNAYISSIGF